MLISVSYHLWVLSAAMFTVTVKIEIIRLFGDYDSAREGCRIFNDRHADRPISINCET